MQSCPEGGSALLAELEILQLANTPRAQQQLNNTNEQKQQHTSAMVTSQQEMLLSSGIIDEEWTIKFEDLVVGDAVARGNFGSVFKGEYFHTDVAIKSVHKFPTDELTIKYIEREITMLRGIRHPNVVTFMGVCTNPVTQEMYIVTEWVPNGNVYNLLKDEKTVMSWKIRVNIARQLAIALTFLHRKNVIHRDIKSENLLLTEHGEVKLADFGFARRINPNKQMTLAGTSAWMAPEIILGKEYNEKCDVFSFGGVVYELITRKRPPERGPSTMYGFTDEMLQPLIPADCPTKLLEIARECCSYEPEQRPSFADLLPRLEILYTELPSEEQNEMQRLLKISQEKMEEIRKESEQRAMEKLKTRLLEASNKLQGDEPARRRSSSSKTHHEESEKGVHKERRKTDTTGVASSAGLDGHRSDAPYLLPRVQSVPTPLAKPLPENRRSVAAPSQGSRLILDAGQPQSTTHTLRPVKAKRMSAIDVFNTRRGPPPDLSGVLDSDSSLPMSLSSTGSTLSQLVSERPSPAQTQLTHPPPTTATSTTNTTAPPAATSPTSPSDDSYVPLMTDVFNPNQPVHQSDGPFKKKSQAELNMQLLVLAQQMREKEEQEAKAKLVEKKQRRRSWGGRKKDQSILTKSTDEGKKEKEKEKDKEKKLSKRFTLSFPGIVKRRSLVTPKEKEGPLVSPSRHPAKEPEKEKEEHHKQQQHKEGEEDEDEGLENGKDEEDLHTDKEEVEEDHEGRILTLRAYKGDIITADVTKKFWGSKDLRMRAALGNKKRVPHEEIAIKLLIVNESSKTVLGLQAQLQHIVKVKRKRSHITPVGPPLMIHPPEFPLQKESRYEGYITYLLPSNLSPTTNSSFYEIDISCLLEEKNRPLVAPLLIEIADTK